MTISKKRKWILSASVIIFAAAAVSGMFFPFLTWNISPLSKLIPKALSEAIKSLSVFGYRSKSVIGFSAGGVLEALKNNRGFPSYEDELTASLLRGVAEMTLIPYVFVLVCVAFGFIRKRWAGLCGFLCALSGCLFTVFSALFHFPDLIYQAVPRDEIPKSSLSPRIMQKYIEQSLGTGWWFLLGSLLSMMLVFFIAMLVSGASREAAQKAAEKAANQERAVITGSPIRPSGEKEPDPKGAPLVHMPLGPAVVVEKGILKGSRYELNLGMRLSIGSDPGQCTLVIPEEGVDPLHCVVSYDFTRKQYHVRDYSSRGIAAGGCRLDSRRVNLLPGDTVLLLGSEKNAIYLEGVLDKESDGERTAKIQVWN